MVILLRHNCYYSAIRLAIYSQVPNDECNELWEVDRITYLFRKSYLDYERPELILGIKLGVLLWKKGYGE